MPAILLAVTGLDPQPWEERLRALAPQRDIRLWPQRLGDPADVGYACAWHAPRGLFARLPRLRAIFSLGAGVDHVFADPNLPDVPVVRIVDPDLTMRMTEYVMLHVLMHHRRHRLYDTQQRERVWHEHAQPPASAVAVGVMGLGVLGRDAALTLRRLGFRVAGWSRTPKTLPDIETFHGDAGLDGFLRRTEILVCLLPATPATQGMLELELIRKLKRDGAAAGAYLINAARGALQGRRRYPGGARGGFARGRNARRVCERAVACREPALAASQGHHHAAQRRRLRPARARRQRAAPDRALRGRSAARARD